MPGSDGARPLKTPRCAPLVQSHAFASGRGRRERLEDDDDADVADGDADDGGGDVYDDEADDDDGD
eukprot:5652221-Pyramimonas_sp.AAC.1